MPEKPKFGQLSGFDISLIAFPASQDKRSRSALLFFEFFLFSFAIALIFG
ncbi:MAG: hypothetical protein J7647_02275 [Cyanobacteria bacterium SBLK]|nr:hypothetical protein [Cyanobacteria bacterium SBLK]